MHAPSLYVIISILSFLPGFFFSLYYFSSSGAPLHFFPLFIGIRRASFGKIGGKGEVRGRKRAGYPAWSPGGVGLGTVYTVFALGQTQWES